MSEQNTQNNDFYTGCSIERSSADKTAGKAKLSCDVWSASIGAFVLFLAFE